MFTDIQNAICTFRPNSRHPHVFMHDALSPSDTWIRLVLWMLIGLDIYACYGIRHSKLECNHPHRQGERALNMIGVTLSILCVITGLWHQQTIGWEASKRLLTISFIFGLTHLAYYLLRIWKQIVNGNLANVWIISQKNQSSNLPILDD